MDQIIYRCGDCQLDLGNRRFTRAGRQIVLEPKVFAVLVQLLRQNEKLVTRDELLDAVWGHRFVTASTLNRVIALARRAFADDADGPKFIQTVYGSGYRYVGPLDQVQVSVALPRAQFGPPPSARLPTSLHELIGRERELARIGTLLAAGRMLTILGTGGMGKTQCALKFAHQRGSDFPDGVWFFDLAPVQSPVEWLQNLALSLSIASGDERQLLERVAHSLGGRRALLLLDNCDRHSNGVGALVFELLQTTDQMQVLATSQRELNFVGERLLRMPPLRTPTLRRPSGADQLQEVADTPAVQLLLARIHDTQPDFALTAEDAPAIVDVCTRLDGMPLALELVAPRFAVLSANQVLDRLDQRFQFLVSEQAGRDPRHRNLMTLLEWSYGLLSPEEQRFLAWLGVFVRGWTVEAAVELAAAFGATPEVVVDLLTGLSSKSLVTASHDVSPPRYRLLESVREFALAKLDELGEEDRARSAHLAQVLRLTEAARRDMIAGGMRESIALLGQESGNIESAVEYAIGCAHDWQSALQIVGSLMMYFKSHGNSNQAKRLCERVLTGAPKKRTQARALALMCKGVNETCGEKLAPEAALREATSIAKSIGDEWAVVYSSAFLALWLIHAGQPQATDSLLEIVERSSRQRGDGILIGLAGLVRAWRCLSAGANAEAAAILQPVRRLGGDFHQHHFIDMYIALAHFRLSDYTGASNMWYHGMQQGLSVGHTRGVAGSIEGCAYIAERRGKSLEACRFLSAAEAIRKRSGSPLYSFWYRHHDEAVAALKAHLGEDGYAAAVGVGTRMREEDVINEAAALLQQFSGASAAC